MFYFLKKITTTKHQDLKYKLEVVNKQKRGFEGRRMAPHRSGDTAKALSLGVTPGLFPGSVPEDKQHSPQALGHSPAPPWPS